MKIQIMLEQIENLASRKKELDTIPQFIASYAIDKGTRKLSERDATIERFAQVIGSQLEKIQKDFPLTQHDYRRIALAYIGTQKANQEFMKDLRSLFDQYKAAMGSYRSIKKKTKQDIENVRFIARKVSQYLYHSKQNARLVSENQSEYTARPGSFDI